MNGKETWNFTTYTETRNKIYIFPPYWIFQRRFPFFVLFVASHWQKLNKIIRLEKLKISFFWTLLSKDSNETENNVNMKCFKGEKKSSSRNFKRTWHPFHSKWWFTFAHVYLDNVFELFKMTIGAIHKPCGQNFEHFWPPPSSDSIFFRI